MSVESIINEMLMVTEDTPKHEINKSVEEVRAYLFKAVKHIRGQLITLLKENITVEDIPKLVLIKGCDKVPQTVVIDLEHRQFMSGEIRQLDEIGGYLIFPLLVEQSFLKPALELLNSNNKVILFDLFKDSEYDLESVSHTVKYSTGGYSIQSNSNGRLTSMVQCLMYDYEVPIMKVSTSRYMISYDHHQRLLDQRLYLIEMLIGELDGLLDACNLVMDDIGLVDLNFMPVFYRFKKQLMEIEVLIDNIDTFINIPLIQYFNLIKLHGQVLNSQREFLIDHHLKYVP